MRTMVLEYESQHLPLFNSSPSFVGFSIPAPWVAYGIGYSQSLTARIQRDVPNKFPTIFPWFKRAFSNVKHRDVHLVSPFAASHGSDLFKLWKEGTCTTKRHIYNMCIYIYYIYICYEIHWILLVKYSKVASVVMFHACLIYIYSDIICSFFKSSEWLQENKGGTQEGEGN
jgi:hypothetical protein